MDKIEKIRQEIERRKNICEGVFERESDTYYQGKAVAYGELLTFLNTLSEEPNKSLEEEMDKFIETFGWGKTKHLAEKELISATARHFAKWGAGHAPLPEDTVIFNKGVAEGKRLMLEDAVEYEVMDFSSSLEPHPLVSIHLDNKKYRFGDKARIIVLPKENEK